MWKKYKANEIHAIQNNNNRRNCERFHRNGWAARGQTALVSLFVCMKVWVSEWMCLCICFYYKNHFEPIHKYSDEVVSSSNAVCDVNAWLWRCHLWKRHCGKFDSMSKLNEYKHWFILTATHSRFYSQTETHGFNRTLTHTHTRICQRGKSEWVFFCCWFDCYIIKLLWDH